MTPDFMTSPERGCAPGNPHKAKPDIFFANPKIDGPAAGQARSRARRVCRDHCPFTSVCFAWAEQAGEKNGIWGGVDMASHKERAKAATFYGLSITAPAEPAVPESDEVLVERLLRTGGPAAFKRLSTEQQALVVRAGLARGISWTALERKFRIRRTKLQALAGDDAEGFDQQVQRLYHAGKSDQAVALALECDPKAVARARGRLGLQAICGPGGRLRRRIGDAQKARRERVPA